MMTMPTIRGAHATIAAVKAMGYHRIILAFQLTPTRTAALFDDFVRELRTVDQVVLAEIYAARSGTRGFPPRIWPIRS